MKKQTIDKHVKKLRCAIYTRKSSEEGLEQEFNSLDAQRESCAAFIRSQIHEGWSMVQTRYDDGGFSGGRLERPALQRMMSDIHAKKIDVVVVYKVDRLTRSLSDFAKIVEIFDTNAVSFVSITQQFNTTTAMGRLTLNVLLSFAQFEREVTGERIRDKIAASKKKGMWMGGVVPLGYDVKDRQLVINNREAETVRYIFQRYVDLGSVSGLKEQLDAEGIVSKPRKNSNARLRGAKPMGRGMLYHLLHNRLYLGEITHKGEPYPGRHEAIVDRALWDQAQLSLDANRTDHKIGTHAKNPSLLAGLLYDDSGERMSPSHAVKNGKRYRYYVSQSLIRQPKRMATGGRRIPAGDIEELMGTQVRTFLDDEGQVANAIRVYITDAPRQRYALEKARQLASRWDDGTPAERRGMLLQLIKRIEVHR